MKTIFYPYIKAFGGTERLILALSRYLHDREIAHQLVCFRDDLELSKFANWPLRVVALKPKRSFLSEIMALRTFAIRHTSFRVDPWLAFDLKSAFYALWVPRVRWNFHIDDTPRLLPRDILKYAWSTQQYYCKILAINSAGFFLKLRAELLFQFIKYGLKRAKTIVVTTYCIRNELVEVFGVEAIVLRPGVSSSGWATKKDKIKGSGIRMLTVSRLEKNKRIDWIIRALVKIEGSISLINGGQWSLEIIGGGAELNSLENLALEYKCSNRIRFSGKVSDEALNKAYEQADLFIMPAYQGYGIPALEALAHCVPVVMHEDSGVAEILNNTLWVQIVGGEIDDLCDGIKIMLGRIETGSLIHELLPNIPLEIKWAEEQAHVCGWL